MTTWNTLDFDIHQLIFSFFCQDLITDYKKLDPNRIEQWLDDLDTDNFAEGWPAPIPQSLRDFSSALLVNQYFRTFLLDIKINGETSINTLQSLQKEWCVIIGESDTNIAFDVRAWMFGAGLFWKNPLVTADPELMWNIVSKLIDEDYQLMLVPHLEDWVLSHPFSEPNDEGVDSYYICQQREDGSTDQVPVVFQSRYSKGSSGLGGSLVAITGLYEGWRYAVETDDRSQQEQQNTTVIQEYIQRQRRMNEKLLLQCPVLRDLEEGGEWWLFNLTDIGGEKKGWIIVDYRGRRMWGSKCKYKMCYWEDVWDIKTWRVGESGTFGFDYIREESDDSDSD